jgi:hypothetical protein
MPRQCQCQLRAPATTTTLLCQVQFLYFPEPSATGRGGLADSTSTALIEVNGRDACFTYLFDWAKKAITCLSIRVARS